MKALAIDIGSTSVRTGCVDLSGVVSHIHQAQLTVRSPNPGDVELDATEIKDLVLTLAAKTIHDAGGCDVVGITNQRATTILFDPVTGDALGPALSWQDLRTVIDCLVLQGEGLRLAPNQSATKAKWLLTQSGRTPQNVRFATIETWITWHLTNGRAHVSDRSNAAVTGLVTLGADEWDQQALNTLGLDREMMPSIVDTLGEHGTASALDGAPSIRALVGDQSASLFGQNCIYDGAKITFGTGAMLDMISAKEQPHTLGAYESGCFPIIARSQSGINVWGVEAIALAAGSCIEWLRDGLGLINHANECASLARSVPSSDGVWFVPALTGLGTPAWDFGARGGFFGLTRGSTRAHLVRAVLEGIAHVGADLIEAAEHQTGTDLPEIRVDGGMTANEFFVQSFANVAGKTVTVSPESEATTRGVGLMALVGAGQLSLDEVATMWTPHKVYEPETDQAQRDLSRATWQLMVERVKGTIPELSAVSF